MAHSSSEDAKSASELCGNSLGVEWCQARQGGRSGGSDLVNVVGGTTMVVIHAGD